MKKPRLIAPHYFYWFHLLFVIGFGWYVFFDSSTQLGIELLDVTLIFLYSVALNYYSSLDPVGDEEDLIEFNPLTLMQTLFIFHYFTTNSLFALFVFLSIDGLIYRQVIKKEFQKIYLNLTFCFAVGVSCFFLYKLLNFDMSEPLLIISIKSIIALIGFVIIEFVLSFGYYAREQEIPVRLSLSLLVYFVNEILASTIIVFPIYLIMKNYSIIFFATLLFFTLLWNEVLKSNGAIFTAQKNSLKLLTKTLEKKDPYTAGHSKRVQKYSIYTGAKMRLTPWRISRLRDAALLHDIGKLVVPSSILNKPGKLTEEEFEKMKEHEEVTSKLIRMITFLRPVALFTSPEELHPFEDNPKELIEPHIIYACDAYDAMTSSRSYRKALSQEVAFKELRDNAGEGKQFKSEVVEALISYLERTKQKHGLGYEQETFHADAPIVGTGSAGLGDLIDEDEKPTKVSKGEPSREITEKAATEENEEVNHDS